MTADRPSTNSALSPTLQIVQMRHAGDSRSLTRGYVAIGAGGYLIWFPTAA